jgi:CubicO group peptidase (beta-lactamase class C family)
MTTRMPMAAPRGSSLFTLPLLLISGCGGDLPGQQPPASIEDGVWVLEVGADHFLWDFSTSPGSLACTVYVLQGGVKLNETPCVTASLDGSALTVSMDTGVQLEGQVELGRGRIQGHLVYPDGTRNPVDLAADSLEAYPLLNPRVGAEGPYAYRIPEDLGDGWTPAPAGAEGIPPRALEKLVASVDRGEMGVLHSLLVARHGHLVLDEYFHGFGPRDIHRLASTTKSVSGLLVGLAIQEGAISSVDTPLLAFFPEARDAAGEGWEHLTLEHLLTMSLALDWSPQEAQNLHGTGPEFFQRVLSHSVVGRPGQDFEYVSANVNLLAGVLHQATGEHAEAFAERALFGPLGIDSWDWSGSEAQGFNLMDGSLRLLPRDMAKLGQLALDGGRWQGEQILDETWIREATSTHIQVPPGPEGYGYLWWTREATGPGGTLVPAFFANGWGSQFIMVFPSLDLVVVTTGGNEYNGKHMRTAEAVVRYLLPEVKTK